MRNFHLGTLGWSYNFWKDSFYPHKSLSKDFLSYYATKFDTVEVDSSFYRIPTEQTIINWKNQTPDNFLFSLKFPRLITHIKMLKDCQRETNIFLQRTKLLQNKLGPLLLQFPPTFGIEHMPDLTDFLHKLSKPNRYAVEVRDKSFLNNEFYDLLRANNAALAWVDSPTIPQVDEVTSDFLYIRWEGDRSKVKGTLGKIEAYTRDKLQVWADKLKSFLSKDLEIFGYFSKYYSGYPPSDIDIFLKLLP